MSGSSTLDGGWQIFDDKKVWREMREIKGLRLKMGVPA
jgi:hypothetical protein